MLKMTIDDENVVSNKDITIKEEMLGTSSTILNNVYPEEWEEDKDYVSRFYYPEDYSKLRIQNEVQTQEYEAGTTIQVNGSTTLTDVDTSKNSKVLRLLGQTSQTGTPTPSSPIPVNVVSGDNDIVVCGKNLFEIKTPDYTGQDAWASYGQSDYTKNNNGYTLNQRYVGIAFQFNNLEIGSQYTISFNVVGNSSFWASVGINVYSGHTETNTGSKDFYAKTTTSRITYTFTASGNNRIAFNSGYTNNTTLTISNIQLEKGSSATTYEEFQGINTYSTNLPVENLVDTPATNSGITGSGLTYTRSDDGSIQITGTTNRAWDYTLTTSYTFEAGRTYTFSADGINREVLYILFNSNNGGQFSINSSNPSRSITIVETQTLPVKWSKASGLSVDLDLKIMIEKGSKANTYTPYGTTPIELCKIGNYQDYIYKSEGNWYKYGIIKKITFNGTESWTLSTTKTITQVFQLTNKVADKLVNSSNSFCNYFTLNVPGDAEKIAWGDTDNNYLYLAIDKTTASSVDNLKTWLSTHNTTIYYILNTPTTTQITDTTLIEQLEALTSQ